MGSVPQASHAKPHSAAAPDIAPLTIRHSRRATITTAIATPSWGLITIELSATPAHHGLPARSARKPVVAQTSGSTDVCPCWTRE